MSLRTRSAILICCLIILSVASTTFVVATNARRALLEQTESDGRVLVQQFVQALASRKQLSISQLVQTWLNPENVNAVWIFDGGSKQLAYGTVPGAKAAPTATDMASVQAAISGKQTLSYLDGDTLKVVAPATDTAGQVNGAILAYIPTDRVETIMTNARQQGVVLLVVVIVLGIIASLSLTRRVTRPAAKLAQAARTIEAGNAFDPDSLNDLTARPDELGQLARVFQTMAREVYAREQALKQQVQELKIEIDEARRARQVADVTETDYFQELQKKAREIREKSEKSGA